MGKKDPRIDAYIAKSAPFDFLAFARTEGRFAPHFAPDGTPTAEILATQADRLAAWRDLQDLAGLRREA